MKRHVMAALGLVAVFAASAMLYAQNQERSRDRDRDNAQQQDQQDRPRRNADGPRGDRGEWATRMNQRMREQLDVSAEEWKVLQPKFEKVTQAQRALRPGPMGFGRRGGPGGPGGGGPGADAANASPVAAATQSLRQTLDQENASAEDIKSKLAALREAREQAQKELDAAQTDLRSLLTQRQEATLVMMGILD